MGLVMTQVNCNTPVDMGAPLQVELLPDTINLDTDVAAGSSSVSEIICTGGYKSFTFACKSTQTGNISIQRYVDQQATIPMGAALTGSLTANTDTVVTNVDGKPFQSMIITVENSSGSAAVLSNTMLLLQAN